MLLTHLAILTIYMAGMYHFYRATLCKSAALLRKVVLLSVPFLVPWSYILDFFLKIITRKIVFASIYLVKMTHRSALSGSTGNSRWKRSALVNACHRAVSLRQHGFFVIFLSGLPLRTTDLDFGLGCSAHSLQCFIDWTFCRAITVTAFSCGSPGHVFAPPSPTFLYQLQQTFVEKYLPQLKTTSAFWNSIFVTVTTINGEAVNFDWAIVTTRCSLWQYRLPLYGIHVELSDLP